MLVVIKFGDVPWLVSLEWWQGGRWRTHGTRQWRRHWRTCYHAVTGWRPGDPGSDTRQKKPARTQSPEYKDRVYGCIDNILNLCWRYTWDNVLCHPACHGSSLSIILWHEHLVIYLYGSCFFYLIVSRFICMSGKEAMRLFWETLLPKLWEHSSPL